MKEIIKITINDGGELRLVDKDGKKYKLEYSADNDGEVWEEVLATKVE